MLASGVYFTTYEWLKRKLIPDPNVISPSRTMLAGGVAGVIQWIPAIPFDVIKSRLQTAPEGAYPGGLIDVLEVLIKEEGVRGLYKGAVPVLIRS